MMMTRIKGKQQKQDENVLTHCLCHEMYLLFQADWYTIYYTNTTTSLDFLFAQLMDMVVLFKRVQISSTEPVRVGMYTT